MEQRSFQCDKVGVREAQKLVYAMLPLMPSLLGISGKWRACGWSVVQLDYDKALEPLHGMCGSMEVEFKVQRTIKRAELTAFLCLLRKVCGTIKVHVDKKGTMDGLRKGEKE